MWEGTEVSKSSKYQIYCTLKMMTEFMCLINEDFGLSCIMEDFHVVLIQCEVYFVHLLSVLLSEVAFADEMSMALSV